MNGTPALIGFVLVAVAGIATAEDRAPRPAERFIANGGWVTDIAHARAEAKKRDRPILAYFTRSSPPCPLCLSLENKVLSSKEFREFARGYVLYLHDATEVNDLGTALADAGGEHAPHFAWLDRDGSSLFPHEVARLVPAFASTGARASRFFLARTAAEAGRSAAVLDYAIERAAVGRLTLFGLERELARLGPASKAQVERMNEIRPRLEFERIRRALKGERFLALQRGGFEPEGVGPKTDFFFEMLSYAEYVEDAGNYEKALGRLRALHGGHDHAAEFFEEAALTLKRLHAAGEGNDR